MKSGKFLFLAIIFLVSLVCISAVSAADEAVSDVIADTNDETVLQESIDDADLGDSENDELGESDEIALDDADETTLKDDSSPGTFADLDEAINGNDNTEITLDSNYLYEGGDKFLDGINITRDLTIDGNGHIIDGNHGARIFHVMDDHVVTFKNIIIINGWTAWYGYGAAIWADQNSVAINCTFIHNEACYGGAISRVNSYNCTFLYNYAAISDTNAFQGSINDGIFIDSAILSVSDLTTKYGLGDKLLFNITGITSDGEEIIWDGFNTTIKIYKDNEELSTNYAYSGDGWVVDLEAGVYNATLSWSKANSVTATITVEPADSSVSAEDVTVTYGDVISIPVTSENATNVDYEILDANDASVKTGTIGPNEAISDLDLSAGEYTVKLTTVVNGNYISTSTSSKLTINKDSSALSAEAVTTTYNVNKDLVITLKDDNDNPLSGVQITVDLDGAKEYTTDENGQVKIAVGSLVPKTYTVKISFAGNENYTASEATAKVAVKKATPTVTAKAKTFTFEDKTKKYTVTLKDNKGNALKNTKVTLKVNGKSYTATTNSKGVATFKLSDITKGKKLTKKATYNAVISFAGDKYYNKVTKNVKLSVKAYAWKTVAKGSKDKAMVKKIQRALKKNHFYISFKGRYLKIDGIYHKYTVMAVKEFQRAKKLKVTGKVDEATAKKLKVY